MRTALLTMITVGIASVIMALPSQALSGGMPVLGEVGDVVQESAVNAVHYRRGGRHRDRYYRHRTPVYRHRVPPVYYAPRAYYPPPVVYSPPPVIYYPQPARPANCGVYRYWNGEYCADARDEPPYIGPRY